jgi:hypothetical protein
MIKRLLSLLAFSALFATAALFAAPQSFEVGNLVKPTELTVQAQDLKLVCPGGAVNSGGSSGTAVGRFGHIGAASVTGSNSTGTTVNFSNLSDFTGKQDSATAVRSIPGIFNWKSATGSILIASGSDQQGSTMLHAAQVQNAASALLNGLLATSCQAPAPEHWLVGGDAATGRETLLLLANPSSVAVTVNLEVYSEGGQVSAAGLNGISVAPLSQTVVPLSSLIPETKTFAIRALSRSGAIAAWLQQRTVRGLLYAGADFVAPATTFAKTLAIPGLLIRGAADSSKLIAANPDYSDTKPVLRVFNPSDKPAKFTAQINGVSANAFGTVIVEEVAPKSVRDFAIDQLANGDYSAFISADQNITAAIRMARSDATKKPNTDFTWLQSAETFTGERRMTVPAAGISKLTIANPNDKTASVTVNATNYNVAANSSIVLLAANSTQIVIQANDVAVGANLVIDVNGSVANVALVNYKNLGGKVLVRVR